MAETSQQAHDRPVKPAEPAQDGEELDDYQRAAKTKELTDRLAAEKPLVGPVEPLSSLIEEFAGGSDTYQAKLAALQSEGWTHIQRMRGDGDCFYRAFAVRYVARLIGASQAARQDALARIEACTPALKAAGFDSELTADFAEPLVNLVKTPPADDAALVQAFNDEEQMICGYITTWLRLATSASLRANREEYLPFLFAIEDADRILDATGMPDMTMFVNNYVEPTGKEADNLQIAALTRILDVGLTVKSLDQSGSADTVHSTRFDGSLDFGSNVALLLRPGHYDVIEKR